MKKQKKTAKQIVIIEGPSGVGKDAIISELIQRYSQIYEKVISVTTRPMRIGETNGSPYRFVNRDQFEEMLRANEIFEFTQRHGTYRGMSKPFIDNILERGKIAVKDVDSVGIRALKKNYPDKVLTIFITADKTEIEKRLINRGDKKTDIVKRLNDYDNIIKSKTQFDCVIENNATLDEVVLKVHDIIQQNI